MRTSRKPIRVLLVDEAPTESANVAAALEERVGDAVVETATGPRATAERLATDSVDCVVAEYDLPECDGLDVFRTVRESHPDLPVLLFPSDGSEAVAAEAFSQGVTDYVRRDAETDQYATLAERIESAVGAQRPAPPVDPAGEGVEQLLKAVPGCVVQLNRDGEFVYANERAADVLGLDGDDVTDSTFNDPAWNITDLDGDPIPDEELPFKRVLDSAEPVFGVQHAIEWPDGTRKVLTINGAPLFDEEGCVEGVVFSMTDSTERLERERRLRQSSARLEALFENSPDMINVHDAAGNIIEPNTRLCQATGYSKAELTEMKVWELDAAIDPDGAQSMWQEMAVGDREQLEGVFRRKDGSTFPVEVHVRRIDLDGESRFVVISRDVTARKDRERQLQEATEQLRATIDAAPNAIMAVDTAGIVQEWNPAAERLFGWSKAEVVGEYNPIIPADAEAEFETHLDRLRNGDRLTGVEVKRQTKDGDLLNVSLSTAPIQEDGEVVGVVGILTDITERQERERELERQNERLEAFTRVVSHDLRNPMNVAVGNLELAREECDSEHLDAVGKAHDRMRALIDDLLTLAREGSTVEDVGPVHLGDLSADCWANVETDDAVLVVDTERAVRGNRSRLQQLLENLMRNAVEHAGRDVTVTVGELPDSEGFFVADDGPGIPPDRREKVFDGGYTTSADGTGFGLAIVKEIVDAHGWTVDVVESEDGGAGFEITGVSFVDS